jgi:hypothetical protein
MKKFVILSALAVALAGIPSQEAAANGGGFNIRMGVGLNLLFDWNSWCNPCQQGCGHGGYGHGGYGHGGHAGYGQGGYLYGFPDGSYQYQGQHYAGQQFTPPPPRRDDKGRPDEASFQSYGYPNLGYSVHQPASYHNYGYQQYYYYTPSLRFDQ